MLISNEKTHKGSPGSSNNAGLGAVAERVQASMVLNEDSKAEFLEPVNENVFLSVLYTHNSSPSVCEMDG